MTKETQRIVAVFVVIFSACSFATFIVSYIGKLWYSCRAPGSRAREVDMTINLYEYCMKGSKTNEFICHKIDDSAKFDHVVPDFRIIRALSITTILFAGSAFLLALLHCFLPMKKMIRKVIILQAICAIMTVVIGISNVFYTALRAQDIVGTEMKFTFGWSCVIGWIGTVVGLLNVIMTIVLMCIYLDNLTERTIRVREELGMDNISISSDVLRRMAAGTDEPAQSSSSTHALESTNEQSDNCHAETFVDIDTLQNQNNINVPNVSIDDSGRINEGYDCNDGNTILRNDCNNLPNDSSTLPNNSNKLQNDIGNKENNSINSINVPNINNNSPNDSSNLPNSPSINIEAEQATIGTIDKLPIIVQGDTLETNIN